MLTLFKGQLSYHEFMREMTYKDMIALRDARIDQLLEEQERAEKELKEKESANIKNQILAK